jgi:hypothetical protein
MKISSTSLHSTPQGLRIGCTITGPQEAWIRFAVLSVPWSMVPTAVMEDWARWLEHDRGVEMLDEPLDF